MGTKLSWTAGSKRGLVMIGDSNPHVPSYPLNLQNLDWERECAELNQADVRLYSVQCLGRGSCSRFWQGLATKTNGYYLQLDQFRSIATFIAAICLHQGGAPNAFERFRAEVNGGDRNRELNRLFDTLTGKVPKDGMLLDLVADAKGAWSSASEFISRPDGLVAV